MIPDWVLLVGIVIVTYIFAVVYALGITFSLVTKNNLGVFSEHPLIWTILIAIGSPISFLCFKFLIIGLLFDSPNIVFKSIPWEFTVTRKKSYIQECYVRTLDNIWGFNDGIRERMLKNWTRFL